MFFIGRCRVGNLFSTLFCALILYHGNMRYAFITTIVLFAFGFGCNDKSGHSHTFSNDYDITVADGRRAYIYLKQRVDTVRLNSIADSCFHEYVRDTRDTFKVSFLYWDDGKDRSPFAEKIWVYNHIKDRYLEYPMKKVAQLPVP